MFGHFLRSLLMGALFFFIAPLAGVAQSAGTCTCTFTYTSSDSCDTSISNNQRSNITESECYNSLACDDGDPVWLDPYGYTDCSWTANSQAPGPDLIVSVNVSSSPNPPMPGASAILSATVENIGTVAVGGTFTNVFQVDNDADHTVVFGAVIDATLSPNLNPSETDPTSATYTFPENGTYYIRACADNDASMGGTRAESNEGNNCGSWVSISISDGSSSGDEGGTGCSCTCYCNNIGSPNEAQYVVLTGEVDCSTIGDPTAACSDVCVTNDTFNDVDPAHTVLNSCQVEGGGSTECSDGVDNDSDGLIDYPQDPGCTSGDDPIESPNPNFPDLISSSVTPTNATANTTTTYSATISNIGSASAGASTALLQSANDASGTGAADRGTAAVATLAASGSATASFSYSFSSTGTFYLRACADKSSAANTGIIAESNEGNNCGAWTAITVTTLPAPVNGSCSAIHYACTVGTSASNIDGATNWTWTCNGSGGGANASCSEPKPSTVVDGACAVTHYACTAGASASNIDGATNWTWTCNGSNGGANASCSEPKPSTVVDGACAITHYACSTGTSANNVSGVTAWTWSCNGSNGGTNVSCSESKSGTSVNGSCAASHYSCDAGTSANHSSGATAWTWDCDGSNGGTDASCSESKAGSLPDLTAGSMTPNTATAGTARTFSATVQKTGSGTVNGTVTTLFQSATSASGADAEIIGTDDKTFSGSSESYSIPHTFTSAGTFYLRACADNNENWQGAITESNEGNNCGEWTPVTVSTPSQPDLTAGAVTPTSAATGVSTALSVVISNTGNATTGGSFTNLFQIDNNVDHGSVTATRTDNSPNLGPGGTDTSSVSYTFATSGTWYVRACADNDASWDDDVTESNEGNNCGAWTAIAVTTPSPLAAACSVTPATGVVSVTSFIWTANPSGGTPPYTYTWLDDVSGSTQQVSKVFMTSGTKTGRVRVRDSVNATVTSANCTNDAVPPGTTVIVNPPSVTASLTADDTSIAVGGSTTLRWSSQNATSCAGTGFSTGGALNNQNPGVSTSALNETGTYNYQLSCAGNGGPALSNAAVTVYSPDASITANPPVIDPNTTTEITASCTAAAYGRVYNPEGGIIFEGPADENGFFTYTFTTPALSAQATYRVECDTIVEGTTVDGSVTVKFKTEFEEF